MKSRLLITVSGMVGSGKTTAAQHVISVFERSGVEATYWRFQRLPCISFRLRPADAPAKSQSSARTRPPVYRQHPLTFTRALGYAARIIAFRVYRRLPGSPRVAVANRYFYDNLVHCTLNTAASRLYERVLAGMIPQPDLSLLLVASARTLEERRPAYTPEYIRAADVAYRSLTARVPALVVINSEPGEHALQRIEAAIEEKVLKRRPLRV